MWSMLAPQEGDTTDSSRTSVLLTPAGVTGVAGVAELAAAGLLRAGVMATEVEMGALDVEGVGAPPAAGEATGVITTPEEEELLT